MRCTDLGRTWNELADWLDRSDVLVLPVFRGGEPIARLDDDLDRSRDATAAEIDQVLGRLRAVIGRFGIRAVYVRQTTWDADTDWAAGAGLSHAPLPLGSGAAPASSGPLTRVTLRVLAGGVVHEVPMVAGWYAAAEDGTAGLYASVT
jgi:hypothetical protein